MLTISKVFTILCLLSLCGNKEYPGSFKNKSVSSSFKWWPSELREKAFLKWASIDLSSKLFLIYGGNVNYYKSVHHPIPTLPVETGKTLAVFKAKKLIYIFFLAKLKGKEIPFLEGARRGIIL